ncbi:MAG TPA: glycosyltransferase family 4 protein, partial [Chthoniobacteraceae bacterium]
MKISFSATNPCHMYATACALAGCGVDVDYYSGYPRWKLRQHGDASMTIRTHSLRTLFVYGLLRIPERYRPRSRSLFLWQDEAFDRWAGDHLAPCDFIHGMPGQCLQTFRSARRLGIATVLNHATGPVREWVRIMEPEYARVGLRLQEVVPYDDAYFAQEQEAYAASDFHCTASSVVRDQLVATGIDPAKICVISYGSDAKIFHRNGAERPSEFRIVFAGQVCLRKGLASLLQALEIADRPDWRIDFYGGTPHEAQFDLQGYKGRTPLTMHGPISQAQLADAFRRSSVAVLPSLEEGFGLVVPQALNCGLPVIVSDRVGGKDLIRHRENGSIVPVGDPAALAAELHFWEKRSTILNETWGWEEPARR